MIGPMPRFVTPIVVLFAAIAIQGDALRGQGTIAGDVDALYGDLTGLYEDLHRNPELAFQETRTAATLAARLKALGYEVATGVGRTGVVALLRNGQGPTAMLRTELDALPVEEKTGVPFASRATARNASGQPIPVMHACGHDLHMAAWVGTAAWMAAHRDEWRGTLMLVGQPAEEIVGGAAAMLKDGLFEKFPKPDFAIGLHDDDTMPAGTVGYRAGSFRASMMAPIITIVGRGGHGAAPHNTVDPIVIAARTVLGLQTIAARENNPLDPLVVTIGSIHGGTQGNIIPDQVRMELSVRTFSEDVRKRTLAAIQRIAAAEAAAAGAPREPLIEFANAGIGPVFNDPALTTRVSAAIGRALGADRVVEMSPKMTSEDFSEYGRAGVPAVLLHIGAVNPAKLADARRTGTAVPAPHSPEWLPELEPTLKGAVRAEIAALLDLLAK
ncbi:MAG: peptidase M20 [Acidobacteria bacterium RIFCSPLOWO2_12_FULL_67_14]|nr:MAG: peptidase M20 [Acidobacteria bacterium RIFCSPLOWO2_02_FULL_67_21]OFW41400.1 MAG: peptidase M20 [Acidobacteria bacterium RIFCSPLOWO2_12_FULL_67_14]